MYQNFIVIYTSGTGIYSNGGDGVEHLLDVKKDNAFSLMHLS